MISKLEQFPTTLSSLHISFSASCNLLDSSLKGGGGLLTCPYPLNFEATFGLGAGEKGMNGTFLTKCQKVQSKRKRTNEF